MMANSYCHLDWICNHTGDTDGCVCRDVSTVVYQVKDDLPRMWSTIPRLGVSDRRIQHHEGLDPQTV